MDITPEGSRVGRPTPRKDGHYLIYTTNETLYIWYDEKLGMPRVRILDGGYVSGELESFGLLELHKLVGHTAEYKRIYRRGE